MLDVTFLSDFRRKMEDLSHEIRDYGYYFKALGLIESYNYLVQLADERTSGHPEVARAPELKQILIEHLSTQYMQHIDLQQERIFNPSLIVGSEFALRMWQEAGYRTRSKRSSKNYAQRLRYWKSIYDNQPLKVPISVSNESLGTATLKKKSTPLDRTGDDIFGPVQQRLFYEIRVKDRSGQIVTYESVIQKRNMGFGSATFNLIPFWAVLNYGSDVGLQPGYPATPGLHFLEDAERTIPSNMSRMMNAFSAFMADILEEDSNKPSFTRVEEWVHTRLRLTGGALDPIAVARELAYQLPF